jgi:hypothetical protein
MVGQVIMSASSVVPGSAGLLLVVGFAPLFGSFYPLTQIYQIETDIKRGDITLAAARTWNDMGTI